MTELWPAITAALRWIDVYGDVDGDGFVETRPRGAWPPQHGWKSSPDAVFHADGRLATGPLALCEVQGYVYGARLGAARIARSLGEMPRAIALVEAAQALQAHFNSAFWCTDIETYALALDGDKQPCRVRTSNPGHCLFTGIAHAERARQVIAGLGRRTLLLRLGRAHRGGERTALQPDVVSQRFGLAARQLAAGGRRGALRRQGIRAAHPQCAVRGGAALRPACACRSCSAASGARAAMRRCNFPVACSPQAVFGGRHLPAAAERARHRASMRSIARSCWRTRSCRKASRKSACKNLTVGDASVDFTVRRHAGSR